MVDSKFQGGFGMGGTHNAVMSSTDYISQGQKNLDNLSVDGNNYYISPSFFGQDRRARREELYGLAEDQGSVNLGRLGW